MFFVILFLILAAGVSILIFVLYDNSIVKECNQKYNERFNQLKNETYNYLQDWCKNENNYSSLISYLNNQANQMSAIKNKLQNQRYTTRRLQKVYERTSEIQEITSLASTINSYSQKLSSLPMSKMIDNTEYGNSRGGFMNGVIYARYSSDNQREESIEGQLRECMAFAEKNDITILNTYIDRAFSAKTDNRPEFQHMISDSKKKMFDVVLVWKYDRFARNRLDSLLYKQLLQRNNIKLICTSFPSTTGYHRKRKSPEKSRRKTLFRSSSV